MSEQKTQEMQVSSVDQDDPLEEGMATHSSILTWRIPWTEEPGGLQSTLSQRVEHNCSDLVHTQAISHGLPGVYVILEEDAFSLEEFHK